VKKVLISIISDLYRWIWPGLRTLVDQEL